GAHARQHRRVHVPARRSRDDPRGHGPHARDVRGAVPPRAGSGDRPRRARRRCGGRRRAHAPAVRHAARHRVERAQDGGAARRRRGPARRRIGVHPPAGPRDGARDRPSRAAGAHAHRRVLANAGGHRRRLLHQAEPRRHRRRGVRDGARARPWVVPSTPRRRPMTEKTNVQAVHDTLLAEFRRDERYVLLGEDVGVRGGVFRVSDGFIEEFGRDRIIDMPVAESSIVGVAIGAAIGGLLPVAEMQFADFSAPAFEQIVDEAARIRYRSNGGYGVPLTIRMPWGGGVHGALYHSQSVEAFYAHVPGLKVVVPSTPRDITGMLRAALRDPDPVIFLEHKATYRAVKGDAPDDQDFVIPLGPADVKREGTDITVFAYGLMLHNALRAAEELAREEISVAVVDVRSLRPLDARTI